MIRISYIDDRFLVDKERKFLVKKKAIINVRNTDHRCFGYALLSYLVHGMAYAKDPGKPEQYDKYFAMYNLDGPFL